MTCSTSRFIDFVEPATQAPFDVADTDMKVITNEERIKKGVKEQHERIRRVLSPRALKQIELEKYVVATVCRR